MARCLLFFTPSALALFPSTTHAQLRETQVLVVYDSRIPDSRAVAEHYAGSTLVPGGAGSLPGLHPRVRVVDLATLPGAGVVPVPPATAVPDIDYPTFISALRNPLRTYLTSTNLTSQIRSIVLTKGLPHRILNIGVTGNPAQPPTIGDNPGQINNAFGGGYYGNLTYASVDSELCLLWQSLSVNENGVVADSKADGWILNPYWRAAQPTTTFAGISINAWPSFAINQTKTFILPSVAKYAGNTSYNGLEWFNSGVNAGIKTTLTPGDIYLVCRLDGNTVADVVASLNRAQNLWVPMTTATLILDKDAAVYGTCPDCYPLDNAGPSEINAFAGVVGPIPPNPAAATQIANGSDYNLTNSFLVSDGRLPSANISFNQLSGITEFLVGPNLTYAGYTKVISAPTIFLASFGANHAGQTLASAATTYAQSFNLLPGAMFNSVESYNGRAFGGLGQNPFAAQQQAADFLADQTAPARIGGTFAIGNVWEPINWTVADNQQLVRHFLLGNLSWAEAAYASLPCLSWQQIVLGDPLARVKRDREDINTDSTLNIDDLYAWRQTPVNLNNSASTDEVDYNLLESTIRANELVNMRP